MEKLAIVVYTNVVFAALVRAEGLNRYVLTIFPSLFPFFYPRKLKEEIFKHARTISIKSGLSENQVIAALRSILAGMRLVPTQSYARRKEEALRFARDPNDWAYVALALYLRRKYEHVLILTWNKDDFREEELEKLGIVVSTPEELLKALRLRYQRVDEAKIKKISGIPFKVYRVLISVLPEEE